MGGGGMSERKLRQALGMYRGERWISFSAPLAGRLPEYPACYVVYQGDRLLYVGKARNLRARFRTHAGAGVLPADCWIKARFGERYGDWAMRESRLIYRLRPPLNRKAA